jgi:hypothetical protein
MMPRIVISEPMGAFMAPGMSCGTTSADAALLAMCERHGELASLIDSMNARDSTHTEAELDAASDAFAELADRISRTPAATFAGVQAKSRVVQDAMRHYINLETMALPERTAWAFCLDVQRAPLPGTLVLPAPTPADAEAERLAQTVIEANDAHEAAIIAGAGSFEAEADYAPEVARCSKVLADRREALAAFSVTGLTGIVAKARAALAVAPRGPEGKVEAGDSAQLLAYAALEDLVRVVGGEA